VCVCVCARARAYVRVCVYVSHFDIVLSKINIHFETVRCQKKFQYYRLAKEILTLLHMLLSFCKFKHKRLI